MICNIINNYLLLILLLTSEYHDLVVNGVITPSGLDPGRDPDGVRIGVRIWSKSGPSQDGSDPDLPHLDPSQIRPPSGPPIWTGSGPDPDQIRSEIGWN